LGKAKGWMVDDNHFDHYSSKVKGENGEGGVAIITTIPGKK